MKMVKCLEGHMYNAEKFNSCPKCANMKVVKQMSDSFVAEQGDIDTEEPDEAKQKQYEIVGRRKVVGCLICVKGAMMGEGFFLVEGHNDIGRAANLEVVLSKELTVSRKAHACISYYSETNQYRLTVAEGKKNVTYNGVVVEEDVLLEQGGIIQIGQCSLRFVPFCDDDFYIS